MAREFGQETRVLVQLDGCGIFSAVVHLVGVQEGAQAWVASGKWWTHCLYKAA